MATPSDRPVPTDPAIALRSRSGADGVGSLRRDFRHRDALVRPLLIVSLAGLLATACGRGDPQSGLPGDADIRQKISGTWLSEIPNVGDTSVETIVNADGSFLCQIGSARSSGDVRRIHFEGYLSVQSGILTETITKDSQPNTPVPRSSRARIIRIDDNEMVVRYESMANEVVFRKERR